jgi:hypothetical protein
VRMLFGWLFTSRTLPKNQASTQMYGPAALRKLGDAVGSR